MSLLTRTLIASALVLAAGSSSAMAGGRHVSVNVGNHFSGNFGHHGHHGHRNVVVNIGGGGCGYYYDRWQDTGSYKWKKRYYECKGWW